MPSKASMGRRVSPQFCNTSRFKLSSNPEKASVSIEANLLSDNTLRDGDGDEEEKEKSVRQMNEFIIHMGSISINLLSSERKSFITHSSSNIGREANE
jgi:hypothetical protein